MFWPVYLSGELIQKGDWIKGKVRAWGGIWHHGIVHDVISTDDGFYVQVVHNVKDGGVSISSLLEEFAPGQIFLVRRPSSQMHLATILQTANANLGKSYSAISQNCEHFCWFCYTWQAKSETASGAMVVAALGVAVIAAINTDWS